MKYHDIDYAVRASLREKRRALKEDRKRKPKVKGKTKPVVIFYGKTDIKSAFRILPMSKKSWKWLVMMAENPLMSKLQFFIDKCLPFGASISCAIFQRFSDALKFLTEIRTNTKKRITNYLDDFLFLAALLDRCNQLIQGFLDMCDQFNIPIAVEKTEWACTRIVFLGILLDGEYMILAIPEEKKQRAIVMLQTMLDKKKATVKEIQALCGFLNFLNKAIVPGRAFTRRMYAKYSHLIKYENTKVLGCKKARVISKLKPHHHIRLDKEFKADCGVWLEFFSGSCRTVVNRPMIDMSWSKTSRKSDSTLMLVQRQILDLAVC